MVKTIVGIMGPGVEATKIDCQNAYELGKFCAIHGLVTLTGGRNEGVMNAALQGAKENGGLTIGILPTDNKEKASTFLDLAICTNMGSGRNYLNVLSSDIVVVCGMSVGTSSEVSLAIKAGKKIILIGLHQEANAFYAKLASQQVFCVREVSKAIKLLKEMLDYG